MCVRFCHILTLGEKKAARKLPTGTHLKKIMNSKRISKTDMKKERSDLRHAISNLHQSSPWAAMSSPSWHNSHLCGWEFQLALTAAALQGLSLGEDDLCVYHMSAIMPKLGFSEKKYLCDNQKLNYLEHRFSMTFTKIRSEGIKIQN